MQPISRAKTYKNKGFTLLELMVVLGIVAALVTMALPRLAGQNTQMRSAVRRLSALTRQLQATAKLQGAVYRLVIDMSGDDDDDKKRVYRYWVEKSTNTTVLSPDQADATWEERTAKNLSEEEQEELKKKNPFQKDTKVLKKEVELPGDLEIVDVEVKRLDKPVNQGKVFIHFFPQGMADEAVIHLKGGKELNWTLAIHPLTGKSDILTEHVDLRELNEK